MTMVKAQLVVLLLTGIVAASPSLGATLKVGPDQAYKVPSAAAMVAKNGDHIEIAPGQYFDCAVWNADNLVIEGTGPGVVITDKTCMGKGFFVIEGNNTTVRDLTLTRSRVPDMNGAGIRLDNGNLTVDSVKFIDNQMCISAVFRERQLRSAIATLTRTGFARGRAPTRCISRILGCCASRIRISPTLGRLIRIQIPGTAHRGNRLYHHGRP